MDSFPKMQYQHHFSSAEIFELFNLLLRFSVAPRHHFLFRSNQVMVFDLLSNCMCFTFSIDDHHYINIPLLYACPFGGGSCSENKNHASMELSHLRLLAAWQHLRLHEEILSAIRQCPWMHRQRRPIWFKDSKTTGSSPSLLLLLCSPQAADQFMLEGSTAITVTKQHQWL